MNSHAVTTYFTGLADVYNRSRPSYPEAAIAFMVQGVRSLETAVDVGCGTGISTRLLATTVDRVIGIDPNEDMLAQARSVTTPQQIEYRIGTGEATRLADGSVDLVLCAQSFHWFDPRKALAEFHRILKPGGRLALIWNIRDDRDGFTAGYGEVVRRAQADAAKRGLAIRNDHAADITSGRLFTFADRQRFANPQVFDLDGLRGRARSASYFPRSGPLRDELEGVLRELYARHRMGDDVAMQQFTEVTIGARE